MSFRQTMSCRIQTNILLRIDYSNIVKIDAICDRRECFEIWYTHCATMFLVDWLKKNVFYLIVFTLRFSISAVSDNKLDWFLDLWTTGRGEAGMGYRGYNWQLVAPKLWTTSISICTTSHYKTERTQEIVPRPIAGERYR